MIDVTRFTKTCNCCGTPLVLEFQIPFNPARANAIKDGVHGMATVHCPNRAGCDLPMFSIPLTEYDALFTNAQALATAKATSKAVR